jgi:activating signal cointegrator complex subunit 3
MTCEQRHNEELLNAELSFVLPWKADGSTFDSPHTKAFLLLQAHFTNAPLPIADYVNDTKSVMDQALRVLSAMLDVAASEGLLDTALGVLTVSRMVVQGVLNDVRIPACGI